MSRQLLFYIVFSVVLHRGLGTVNFALNKTAVQSSTLNYFFNWTADRAVDGNADGSNPDKSKTCSSTIQERVFVNNTWEVDLGLQIIIKNITVYGRTDGLDQLSGFKLYIGNVSNPWRYNQEIPINSSSTSNYVFKPNDAIASVISLTRFEKILLICEVTVEGHCLDGNFSEFCNLTCGKCFADQPCNKKNGTCPLGCSQGWKGTFCNEECDAGTYGFTCNETCGYCLNGNNSCSHIYGQCNGGCHAGWKGETCKSECDAGTYGFTCNETCGYCLSGNNSCSHIYGQCNGGCQTGWKGETCKSGCERGNYGYNCNETCGNCLYGNSNCSTSDGNCTSGCIAGWQDYHCKRGTLGMVTPDDVGPNAGVIVGSVLAAVGVSIFAMVIIIVIVQNKRKKDNNETSTDNVTTAAFYANLVVGSPDAACKINVRSRAEKDTTFSAIEEKRLQKGMPIGATNGHSGVMEPDVPVNNDYEDRRNKKENKYSGPQKLRDVPESTESAYYTIDHNLIDDQIMESMKNCSTFVETLQELESALQSVEEEISVLLARKEKLLSKELERARANHLGNKRKEKDSHKDKDITSVNYVQTLQSLEEELRILEEKRKFLLGRKEILPRQELAKTTENEK